MFLSLFLIGFIRFVFFVSSNLPICPSLYLFILLFVYPLIALSIFMYLSMVRCIYISIYVFIYLVIISICLLISSSFYQSLYLFVYLCIYLDSHQSLSVDHLSMYLDSHRLSFYLFSFSTGFFCTWLHLASLCLTRLHLTSVGFAWFRLLSIGFAWCYSIRRISLQFGIVDPDSIAHFETTGLLIVFSFMFLKTLRNARQPWRGQVSKTFRSDVNSTTRMAARTSQNQHISWFGGPASLAPKPSMNQSSDKLIY